MITQHPSISVTPWVVGNDFSSTSTDVNIHKKETKMPKCIRQFLIAMFAVCLILVPASAASATNAHQDHRGACARSTTSISTVVTDLSYNGVAGKFASALGIKSINGSVTKQLKNQLVVGKIAQAVVTNNRGCDGHGGSFGAGKRSLYKGELVAVKVPAKYGKDACAKPGMKGCVAVTITVSAVLPSSCSNLNTRVKIKVKIWVKKTHHAKHKAKPKPCTCKPAQQQTATNHCDIPGHPVDSVGNCSNEQIQVAGAGNCNSTNSGNLSGTGDSQGSCINTTVVCNGPGSCSPSTTNVCTGNTSGGTASNGSTGGDAQTTVCPTENPPPPCSCPPPPPPPSCTNGSSGPYPACPLPQPSSANCTKLTLTQNPTVNLGIRTHVDYSAQNATLSSTTFTWGDGTTTTVTRDDSKTPTVTGSDADHTYARGGNYIVNATLKFTSPNGNLSSTCSAQQITPKDGTTGAGTPPTGGPGSGGTPTPNPGSTGTPCYMPDGSLGYKDQFGYCNPA